MLRAEHSMRAHGPYVATGLVALFFGLQASAVRGDNLIGMNDVGQSGGPDELVQCDPNTGESVILHVFASTNFNYLESLAFDPRENILWTTNDNVLIRVQLQTYVATMIGTIPLSDIDGLAVQPATGALFGITYGGSDLVRIDKTDASVVVLNGSLEVGERLEDLAFDSTGRLYVLTSRALVEVGPETGARLSRLVLTGATSLEGLVWDATRGMFLSAADRGDSKDLVSINRTTGQVTFLSPSLHSGCKDIEALAFIPGSPIVPVAMQAVGGRRDPEGALLEWQAFEASRRTFFVQRALHPDGPWLEVGSVSEPVGRRADGWRYQYRDPAAAANDLAVTTLHYRVGARDAEGIWSWVEFELAALPRGVVLRPNSPNPFNPTTAFAIRLDTTSRVDLGIFDIRGRLVRTLSVRMGPGEHALVWDGRDDAGHSVAGGVYPYVLTAAGRTLRGEAVLVK